MLSPGHLHWPCHSRPAAFALRPEALRQTAETGPFHSLASSHSCACSKAPAWWCDSSNSALRATARGIRQRQRYPTVRMSLVGG